MRPEPRGTPGVNPVPSACSWEVLAPFGAEPHLLSKRHSFTHSFINLYFCRYLLNTYSVPGTVLGIGHEGIHQKTRDTKSLALMELMVSQGRQTADT